MHDGVVWELALKPKNISLSRSWQLIDKPNGDRIGEALFYGHTLDEAITLVDNIIAGWNEGINELGNLINENNEQISVIKALDILFKSGRNILEFYRLREILGKGRGNHQTINKMVSIVDNEIVNSEMMIALCENDGRLGYHSEAEGYKFFPQKLKHRISTLEILKNSEFTEVINRFESGNVPLEYYLGIEEDVKSYHPQNSLKYSQWEFLSDGESKFKMAYDDDFVYYELTCPRKTAFRICNEFRLMFPSPVVVIDDKGSVELSLNCYTHQSIFGNKIKMELDKWAVRAIPSSGTHIKVRLKRTDCGWTENTPYKISIATEDGVLWNSESEPVSTLGKSDISPGQFGWIIPR